MKYGSCFHGFEGCCCRNDQRVVRADSGVSEASGSGYFETRSPDELKLAENFWASLGQTPVWHSIIEVGHE